MSRSAMAREANKARLQARMIPPTQNPSAAAIAYWQSQGADISTMFPGYTVANPTEFVPIRLTGDEEDTDADPNVKTNVLPMHGSTSNYNINNLLYNNILENDYFKALYQLRTYHEVIDEIYRSVEHVEPWQTGTARFPSSAFCLMVKFMLMKLTVKQMNGILAMQDNPFVRAVGFLYLRYTCPPTDLWKWFEPFIEDETEIQPCSDKNVTMTIGEYCIKLLTEMQYYGTTLPRIPVPIERKIKVMLLLLNEKKKRRNNNLRFQEDGLFDVGVKVRAIYSDAENEPAWYEAVIESKDVDNENKYWVKFPEYGNTEYVDLGDMELLDKKVESSDSRRDDGKDDRHSRSNSYHDNNSHRGRDRSRDPESDRHYHGRDGRDRGDRRRDSRSRSRDRDNYRERDRRSPDHRRGDYRSGGGGMNSSSGNRGSTDNLLEQVLQNERNASAAVGKNYGHRPTSYKGSLSLKADRYTARQKSPTRDNREYRRRSPSPARSHNNYNNSNNSNSYSNNNNSGNSASTADNSISKSRIELSQEQIERMKMLKERYGDASARKD